jgi:predicted GIY-YIG superfamily endonuclease
MPGSENSKAIMFFYVYVLEAKDGELYIGYTKDLKGGLKNIIVD